MKQRYGTDSEHAALLAKQNSIPLKGEIFFVETNESSDDSSDVSLSDISFDEIANVTSTKPVVNQSETLVSAPQYSVMMSTADTTIETPNLLPSFLYTNISEDGYKSYKAIFRQTYKTNLGTTDTVSLVTPNLLPHAIVKNATEWNNSSTYVLGKGEFGLEIIDD